jgi:hypothetical protein
MGEVVRIVMIVVGCGLIVFFAGISLVQVFLPDMMFALVSLRNRHGRRRGNILFAMRNLAFLVPGVLLLVLCGYVKSLL